MTKRKIAEPELNGKNPDQSGLEKMLKKAKKLGFSKTEISRLKVVYSPKKVDIIDQMEMVGKSS